MSDSWEAEKHGDERRVCVSLGAQSECLSITRASCLEMCFSLLAALLKSLQCLSNFDFIAILSMRADPSRVASDKDTAVNDLSKSSL